MPIVAKEDTLISRFNKIQLCVYIIDNGQYANEV